MDFHDFLRIVLPKLGFNWSRYRKSPIRRRLSRRISLLGIRSWEEYSNIVLVSPGEQCRIRRMLGITISRFFRNTMIFRSLERDVIPDLIQHLDSDEFLDVWCVGGASGQEALSLSILLRGVENPGDRVIGYRILSTDIDEAVLKRGLKNQWSSSELASTPSDISSRFFSAGGDGAPTISEELYENVLFARHDYFQGPPLRRAHLVLCRNSALTYTSGSEKKRIMKSIVSVITDGGYLVIGRKERLPKKWAAQMGLTPLGRRIFRRFLEDGSDGSGTPILGNRYSEVFQLSENRIVQLGDGGDIDP